MPRLTHEGLEFVTYPRATKEAVLEAAEAWEEFTKLPQELKDQFSAKDLQFSVGYERKGDGSRGSNDSKENFDFTLAGIRELENNPHTAQIKDLLKSTKKLFTSLEPVANDFCQTVESTYGIANFHQTAARSASNRFIRFLHYPPTPVGTVIGEAHADHSGYTFHLYESTDGCRGLSPTTNEWLTMPVTPEKMVVFGGMQLQLLSEGTIKALCHEIVANPTTNIQGRLAIVCFNLLDGVPVYNRQVHGRLQDQPLAFNYTASPGEFAALFVPQQTPLQ